MGVGVEDGVGEEGLRCALQQVSEVQEHFFSASAKNNTEMIIGYYH